MYQHTQQTVISRAQSSIAITGNVLPAEDNRSNLDALFADHGAVRRFQPGEIVFMEGDDADAVYKVASGMVRAYVMTQDGRRQIERFVSDRGTLAITAMDTHSYTVEAVDCVDIQICPRSIFDAAIMENRALRAELMHSISAELTAIRDQMVVLGRMTAIEKVTSFLLKLTAQLKSTKAGFVRLAMTRADIGDHLGLTLETVSRLLNGLNRDGIIEMPAPDRFRIADPEALSSLATPI